MADKKDNERFNNPFSALKGLSVSDVRKPDKKRPETPTRADSPVKTVFVPDDEVDFFAEMDELGVRKIAHDKIEKSCPEFSGKRASSDRPVNPAKIKSGGGSLKTGRGKRLRRGDVLPEAELDLHGVNADAARQKVAWFLENAVFHGFETARIVTGRGSHSGSGPVLRPLVEEYLDGPGRAFVVEWVRAPQKQGGEGAIIVFLRQ